MLTTTIDRAHYRSVMGHLPTGVVAVSAIVPGTATPCGLVVGTFQSLSLEPALVSFSVADTSASWPKLRSARRLCASVLAAGQESVCRALSSKHPDKFAFLDWSLSPAGSAYHRRARLDRAARSPTSSTRATISSSSPRSPTCRPRRASRWCFTTGAWGATESRWRCKHPTPPPHAVHLRRTLRTGKPRS